MGKEQEINQIVPYDHKAESFSPMSSRSTFIKDSRIMNYFYESDENFRDYFPGSKKYYLNTKKCNKCVRKTAKFFLGLSIAAFIVRILRFMKQKADIKWDKKMQRES